MSEKFQTIYENYMNRNSAGGFLPGDYVKIKEDALSDPSVKSGNEQYKEMLKSLIARQDSIRIKLSNINTTAPSRSHVPNTTPNFLTGDIGEEVGMGMVPNKITVPLCCLEVDLTAWGRVPDNWKIREPNDPAEPHVKPLGEELPKK